MADCPDDKTLIEFISKFVGHNGLDWNPIDNCLYSYSNVPPNGPIPSDVYKIPLYLKSVDAWLSDVWPKIEPNPYLQDIWAYELYQLTDTHQGAYLNASAYDRCLALYNALNGTLP